MDNLNFYYLIEFTPQVNSIFPGLDLNEFPGMTQAVAGSDEFETYDLAAEAAVAFLKSKLAVLNENDSDHKIFFEKNQFDKTLPSKGEWEENEVVQIYIADSKLTEYNSLFKARVFFVNTEVDDTYIFDAPTTLQ